MEAVPSKIPLEKRHTVAVVGSTIRLDSAEAIADDGDGWLRILAKMRRAGQLLSGGVGVATVAWASFIHLVLRIDEGHAVVLR